ncbi:soluble starch synthase 3, chloroplastic/amyloplastic-like [Telopea speciosissima]|uniref:soluble starch synthase 3, chloroplastic/amyloplastic-like n=1 Tax=Telopea speciosissima TaxID=54955 RepID=UPI001CC5DBA3|nr:soluble starch synthase 3, chloroplastic/amyloplastic-like [Telopea speciosissima]
MKAGSDEDIEIENESDRTVSTSQLLDAVRSDETEENGRMAVTDDDATETSTPEILAESEEGEADGTLSTRKTLDVLTSDSEESGTIAEIDEYKTKTELTKPELLNHSEISLDHDPEMEECSIKKVELDADMYRQMLEDLAQENFSKGNKMFVYPQVVKLDQDIELFLNRSLSTLKDEPDVLIMGAFNDWRWKHFMVKLNKTHLNGDCESVFNI